MNASASKRQRLLTSHYGVASLCSCACLVVSIGLSAAVQTSTPAQGRGAHLADQAVEDDVAEILTMWPRGRYRVTPGDVLHVTFPYVSEFDQTVTVQPDGYIALRGIDDLRVAGRTVAEIKTALIDAYEPILREPVVTIVLKEFEKPYFVAAGEVTRPGKYDLRGATTMTQALAIAGGPLSSAKQSEVLLFRSYSIERVAVQTVNVKKMYSSRDFSEDPILRPGDTVFVPKSSWAAIAPFLPRSGIVLSPFIR